MGNLHETPIWEPELYRIQIVDPILGGEDGIVNIQPGQLTRRTAFLRQALALQHTEDGLHRVTGTMLAPDAALAEAKLLLDVGTARIAEALDANGKSLEELRAAVGAVIGPDGTLTGSLVRCLRLLWAYGGFDIELFAGKLILREMEDQPVRSAVAGDDSVDCADTSRLRAGMRLLIRAGDAAEEIEIREVLTRHRFRTVEDLRHAYDGGTLGHTTWTLEYGQATAEPGTVYLSRVSKALAGAASGWLAIRRDRGHGDLLVQIRTGFADAAWRTLDPADMDIPPESERIDLFYRLECPESVQIRVECRTARVEVDHLALVGVHARQFRAVRTPRLWFPETGATLHQDLFYLDSSLFRCAWADNLAHTEFQLCISRWFDAPPALTARSGPGLRHVRLSETAAPPPGLYHARCRQISDMGDASRWSRPVVFTVAEPEWFFGFAGTPRTTGFNEAGFNSLRREPVRFGFAEAPGAAGFGQAPFACGSSFYV